MDIANSLLGIIKRHNNDAKLSQPGEAYYIKLVDLNDENNKEKLLYSKQASQQKNTENTLKIEPEENKIFSENKAGYYLKINPFGRGCEFFNINAQAKKTKYITFDYDHRSETVAATGVVLSDIVKQKNYTITDVANRLIWCEKCAIEDGFRQKEIEEQEIQKLIGRIIEKSDLLVGKNCFRIHFDRDKPAEEVNACIIDNEESSRASQSNYIIKANGVFNIGEKIRFCEKIEENTKKREYLQIAGSENKNHSEIKQLLNDVLVNLDDKLKPLDKKDSCLFDLLNELHNEDTKNITAIFKAYEAPEYPEEFKLFGIAPPEKIQPLTLRLEKTGAADGDIVSISYDNKECAKFKFNFARQECVFTEKSSVPLDILSKYIHQFKTKDECIPYTSWTYTSNDFVKSIDELCFEKKRDEINEESKKISMDGVNAANQRKVLLETIKKVFDYRYLYDKNKLNITTIDYLKSKIDINLDILKGSKLFEKMINLSEQKIRKECNGVLSFNITIDGVISDCNSECFYEYMQCVDGVINHHELISVLSNFLQISLKDSYDAAIEEAQKGVFNKKTKKMLTSNGALCAYKAGVTVNDLRGLTGLTAKKIEFLISPDAIEAYEAGATPIDLQGKTGLTSNKIELLVSPDARKAYRTKNGPTFSGLKYLDIYTIYLLTSQDAIEAYKAGVTCIDIKNFDSGKIRSLISSKAIKAYKYGLKPSSLKGLKTKTIDRIISIASIKQDTDEIRNYIQIVNKAANNTDDIYAIEASLNMAEKYLAEMDNPFRMRQSVAEMEILCKDKSENRYKDEVYVAAKGFFEAREKAIQDIKPVIKKLKKQRVELIKNPLKKISWKVFHGFRSTIRNYSEFFTTAMLALLIIAITAAMAPLCGWLALMMASEAIVCAAILVFASAMITVFGISALTILITDIVPSKHYSAFGRWHQERKYEEKKINDKKDEPKEDIVQNKNSVLGSLHQERKPEEKKINDKKNEREEDIVQNMLPGLNRRHQEQKPEERKINDKKDEPGNPILPKI